MGPSSVMERDQTTVLLAHFISPAQHLLPYTVQGEDFMWQHQASKVRLLENKLRFQLRPDFKDVDTSSQQKLLEPRPLEEVLPHFLA